MVGLSGLNSGYPWLAYLQGKYPPPPCPAPHLILPWGGGGGQSVGQHKNFCYGSLCCCVGDGVVRHCQAFYKKGQTTTQGAVQCILVEDGEHFQESKVKWSRTKNFTPSQSRSRSQ